MGDSDCTLANQYCRDLGTFTDNTCQKGFCDCSDTHLWDSSGSKCSKSITYQDVFFFTMFILNSTEVVLNAFAS